MRKGFTLVECMLAGALLCIVALALLEGISVSTRIAHENAQILTAEAIAWDAAWKRFNENYDTDLTIGETTGWVDLSAEAAPELTRYYDTAPQLLVKVEAIDTEGWQADMKVVTADVAWGPASRRKKLSDAGHEVRLCRGRLGRAP